MSDGFFPSADSGDGNSLSFVEQEYTGCGLDDDYDDDADCAEEYGEILKRRKNLSREESIRESEEQLKKSKQVLKEADDEIRHSDLLLQIIKGSKGEIKVAKQEMNALAKELVKTCKQAWKNSGSPEAALFAVMRSGGEKDLGFPTQRTEDNLYSVLFVKEEPEKNCVQNTYLTLNAKNKAITCSCVKKYFDDIVVEGKAISYFRPLMYKLLVVAFVIFDFLFVCWLMYDLIF